MIALNPKTCPRIFYVGGEGYKILFTKKIKHCGDTDGAAKVIRIRLGMSPRETMATLIHELIHALDFEYNFKIKHKTVYKMERAMISFLLDNFLLKG